LFLFLKLKYINKRKGELINGRIEERIRRN